MPPHAGATGRDILGRIGWDALGSKTLKACTPETVTDRTELSRLLEHDRQAGYVISVGQQLPLAAGAVASFSRLAGMPGAADVRDVGDWAALLGGVPIY